MLQSENTDEEDYSEAATTAPASPAFSELSIPMPNEYKVLIIRIHKNVNTTPPVVFKVKASQTLGSIFERACHYFNFEPSM